jgi:hypothetical protein
VRLGAILQVQGDHEFVARHLPASFFWEASLDGKSWRELEGTRVSGESRLFRIHRLKSSVRLRFIRMQINAATDGFPVLREVEFYQSHKAVIPFPEWIAAVNTTHDKSLPGHGQEFIPLARSTSGGGSIQAQQIWVGEFNDAFLNAEPRPLCAFLSGNFKDWCEVDRSDWRGVQQVLGLARLPLWASCGGAQGLAIIAETGVDQPWDCPHCRDPGNPKLPIYTHIGHTGQKPCGDYSACRFERGPVIIRTESNDPAFEGLPAEFSVMESHCGQIEWAPKGWTRIATAGPGGLTRNQCLRFADRPIYAAQFHIEMEGTPETSRRVMANFLAEARRWGGYRANVRPLPLGSEHGGRSP